MRKLENIIVLTGTLFFCSISKGQFSQSGYFNQANQLFERKDYYAAAQYYEKYLVDVKRPASGAQPFAVKKKVKSGPATLNNRWQGVYRLAECYRLCHKYTLAEKWYKEAAGYPATAFPLAQYWYGVSLRANGKYEEAMTAITRFQETYSKMDAYLTGADQEIKNLRFIIYEQRRSDKDSFVVSQAEINGLQSAYAASGLNGDSMVFTGVSPDSGGGRQGWRPYKNQLYRATKVENYPMLPSLLNMSSSEKNEEGMSTFSQDGRRMFFTRWDGRPGKKDAAIYESERTDSGWTAPVKLGNGVNKEGYSSAQPFLTESVEGKYLLFSSDRPGGSGQYDLWYAAMDSGYQVLNVQNMGATINSPGDEQCPFFHEGSRSLVFSSNGRPGMGGFDIFYSRGNISFSDWERPVNAGMLVNSSRDDLYFVSSDSVNLWNTGWLSSDRASDCCLALFSYREINSQFVSGRVVDCQSQQPLMNVEIKLTQQHPGKLLQQLKTDENGEYHIELHNSSTFNIFAEKGGYQPASKQYVVHFKTGNDSLRNDDICLSLEPDSNLIKDSGDVLLSLNKPRKLSGFAYGKSSPYVSSYDRLDSLATLMSKYPSMTVRIDGYTDGVGGEAYNLRLAQARVDASIRYLVQKGISPERLKGRAMGKCCPLVPETVNGKDDPAAREKNRRVEYTLLSF